MAVDAAQLLNVWSPGTRLASHSASNAQVIVAILTLTPEVANAGGELIPAHSAGQLMTRRHVLAFEKPGKRLSFERQTVT